jgi:dTDP-4-dehydrorhamnose reductase
MRLLILGGNGMAGHMLVHYFRKSSNYSVFYSIRDRGSHQGLVVDARDSVHVEKMIDVVAPDVIINAIGILNDRAERNAIDAFLLNGLFPHQLKRMADKAGSRIIHISSDCVFSGELGGHKEDDVPDGHTTYARTKALGEIKAERHLTIRTSIVGPEIREQGIGLMDWFLRQQGTVKGYQLAIWNGVTTLELAKAIHHIIEYPLSGLLHLTAPEAISKLDLLRLFQHAFEKEDVKIVPDDAIRLDRTLLHTRKDFIYEVPSYDRMLLELREWMRYR